MKHVRKAGATPRIAACPVLVFLQCIYHNIISGNVHGPAKKVGTAAVGSNEFLFLRLSIANLLEDVRYAGIDHWVDTRRLGVVDKRADHGMVGADCNADAV